ncbi:MAG: hypothetical protein V5A34_07385 [Halapricum sp.]
MTFDRTQISKLRSGFEREDPEAGVFRCVKERERFDGAWTTVAFGQLDGHRFEGVNGV